ncbi:hypothetical protein, partial [Priestia megaterium]|uniref:hypothetical protein n=2 Tax=Priestia megaterium TaxID=1404 RepID=UPI003000B78A
LLLPAVTMIHVLFELDYTNALYVYSLFLFFFLCLSFAPLPLYIPSFYSGVVVSFALFMENKIIL